MLFDFDDFFDSYCDILELPFLVLDGDFLGDFEEALETLEFLIEFLIWLLSSWSIVTISEIYLVPALDAERAWIDSFCWAISHYLSFRHLD